MDEILLERFNLATERIREIISEGKLEAGFADYFASVAAQIIKITDTVKKIQEILHNGADKNELPELNNALYNYVKTDKYNECYGNPEYAVEKLGEGYGQLLAFLYKEVRGIIPFLFEDKKEDVVILLEVFLEVYQCFVAANEENALPETKDVHNVLYYFVSDYADKTVYDRVASQVNQEEDFAQNIIMTADLSDTAYLYSFGEYVSDNEIKTAKYLSGLSEEKIRLMAEVYVKGYEKGFELTGKDLSKKKTVNIRYTLGFERIVRSAIGQFKEMGLDCIIYRQGVHLLNGSTISHVGYMGACPNRQYDYDHREDIALFLDKALNDRRIEILQHAFEENKAKAYVHAGPAVMEVFGENPFEPVRTKAAPQLSEKQQQLQVEYLSRAGEITNRYIKGEERSFTIIAWPTPEIGADFESIFDETIKINTLDYTSYRDMQQLIIDELDKGAAVRVKGSGKNTTDIKVALKKLTDPSKETKFENCVADVNIPVGEVFTSPVLLGTNGRLFVTEVYLEGFRFENLELIFEDGMVTDYSCTNFDDKEKCREYIKENILKHHESLPMGEFAIGTNTTAYSMAKKFNIFDRLPILIAEKTGPHFAVGDTCYSHAEDIKVYNPDGKEIVARDNSISIKRKEDIRKAYFNCHTDITIPYDELLELSVEHEDGSVVSIIKDGLFVPDGVLDLNIPLT